MQASRRETLAFAFNVVPHACCVEEGRDALALRKSVLIGPPPVLDRDGFNAVIACFAAHPSSLIDIVIFFLFVIQLPILLRAEDRLTQSSIIPVLVRPSLISISFARSSSILVFTYLHMMQAIIHMNHCFYLS